MDRILSYIIHAMLFPVLFLALLLTASGCGWLGSDAEESAESDVFIQGLDDIGVEAKEEGEGEPIPLAEEGKELALQLEIGDRFPLIKTVQQTVTQTSDAGTITSTSLLKMILEINVEELTADRTRMSVRYHHINYVQDVDGEQLSFDSRKTDQPLHPSVAAYHGMINNQFSFWVGRQNGIEELVGFEEFLKRCFQHVPPAERQATLNQMTSSSGDQGVANFIDDSIGLLPYGAEEDADGRSGLSIGDAWKRERKVELPVPMQISDKCLLSELTDGVATIDIHGSIGPSTSDSFRTRDQRQLQIEVRGGSSTGRCIIDRHSGLPIQSKIERMIDMLVRLPDGQRFDQQKQIVTTIEAFPSTNVSEPVRIGRNDPPSDDRSSERFIEPTDSGTRRTARSEEIEYGDDELPEAFDEPDDTRAIGEETSRRGNPVSNRRPRRPVRQTNFEEQEF